MPRTINDLALALASALWDDDALHVELTPAEKTAIDTTALALLRALGHNAVTESMDRSQARVTRAREIRRTPNSET